MFQFGRVYPSYWESDGRAGHCPWAVEWLSSTGEVLAASDYENKQKFLSFVCQHRAPNVAAHWDYLLRPMVLHHVDQTGPLRYRQLEYYRMPLAVFLAVEDAIKLAPADYMHLATASGSAATSPRPAAERGLKEFEAQHSYDPQRQLGHGESGSSIQYWSCGQTLVVTGDAAEPHFVDAETGGLAKFRHQYFMLFLIAHFHRAALLMFSDRLAGAVSRLDVSDSAAVQAFRLGIRQAFESFLRFSHRYWFYEVSDQPQTQALFNLCRRHLGVDRLYSDVRQELQDMSQFLENDAMRRQNETVVRLTVVTIFGLIGTVVTGFLGMNLFALAEESALTRLLIFGVVTAPTILLTLYTVKKSRRLSEFLDALSDDTLPLRAKWRAFLRVW